MTPRVGVWDQWCVMSDRPYVQEGKPALLNEANCRAIVANFAAQKDDLPCNKSHEKSSTVAYYNALALFIGGRMVTWATHDPAVPPPTLEDLPRGDDGTPPDDGIYWHRARLTDLGAALAQYIRKVSPEFVSAAKNSFGDDIGYQALGGAWTNYPFLDGCEKHEFERKPMAKKSYMQRCYEDAGVTDKDDDASKMSKINAYWRGKHGGASMAKYEASAGCTEKDEPASRMSKMSAYMTARSEYEEEAAAKSEKPAEMQDPVVQTGTPPEISQKPASTDQVAGQGHSMEKNLAAGIEMEKRLLDQQRVLDQKIADFDRKQAAEAAKRAAHEYTRKVWTEGRILPRGDETEQAAQERILHLFEKGGKDLADRALLDPHSYTPREAMLTEYTRNGMPFGWQDPQGDAEATRPDYAIIERAVALAKQDGKQMEYSKETYLVSGKDKGAFNDYAARVAQQNPALAKAWMNQPKRAMSGME